MKKRLLLFCVICFIALTACSQDVPEPAPEQSPPVSVSQPAELPEPEPEPAPEPEPEPVPEQEPLPEMTAGDSVTVDGFLLPGGSVWMNDVAYVRLREVAKALDCDLEIAEISGMLLRDKAPVAAELSAEPVEVLGETWVPVDLLPQLHLGYFYDAEFAHHYYTSGAVDFEPPAGYNVPILMYHAVSDEVWSPYPDLFVKPSEMEAQLQYLQENGFTTIFVSDLEHIDEIEKPVMLTVDDGYLDNYTELFPLLKKYNAKATIFAITKSIDTHHLYFNWEQAREMADSGLVEIHSHTVSHPNLDELTYEQQQYELKQSQLDILRNLGRESYAFCYPSGRYNADTTALLPEFYNFALRMTDNDCYTGGDPYQLSRWNVQRSTSLGTFIDMVE